MRRNLFVDFGRMTWTAILFPGHPYIESIMHSYIMHSFIMHSYYEFILRHSSLLICHKYIIILMIITIIKEEIKESVPYENMTLKSSSCVLYQEEVARRRWGRANQTSCSSGNVVQFQ